MNNAELFKKVFGIYAEEFWAFPTEKMLDWIVSDVPDTTVGEWIPVTERLPEDDYAKLVYEADNENKFLAIYEDGRWKSFDPNDYNETYFDETDYGNIVAWMELPEDYEYPPKDFMNPPEGSEE